ncbi:MAG: VWA domain-containing protein [Propionibacteriaceae bacterium]|jgi:uncharacterized protein YegL|nr:VWA domain-containing protein [Propionibacteriaceae bacterium]
MSDSLGKVVPFYLVADQSGSMVDDIGEVNAGLLSLLAALQSEPLAAAKTRFAVVGFADHAITHLPLSDLRQIETMPTLSAGGTTSYAAAFQLLLQAIPEDVAALKAEGYQVSRPAVFLLTDGEPNRGDGWEQALAELTDPGFRARPNILAFGIGQSNHDVVRQVATRPEYAFAAAVGADTGKAIAEFAEALSRSVVASGNALAADQSALMIEAPKDFIPLALDVV